MNIPSQYKSPVRYLSRDTSQYKSPVRYLSRDTNEYSFAI